MEGKKISFGFMKTKKAEKPVAEEKKEYIECIDEKAIKVIGGDTVKEDVPLVIPMKPNTLVTAERLKQIAEEVEKAVEEAPEPGERPKQSPEKDLNVNENESLEQMAVRELLEEAKKEIIVENTLLTVPTPSNPVLDGEKESTLDDYEAVPIQQFGMAMLRGMGWTPNKEQSKHKELQLRPKGLGLGADKVIKENQKKNQSKDNNEELTIVKNAFVKITTGKYSGCYGKVVSLDEDNGRVMVDISIKKEMVSLSEFMMQPVTKSEFDKESRVINSDTYEEYKKSEQSSQKSSNSKHSSSKDSERDGSSSQKYSDNSKDKTEREGNSKSKNVDNSNGRRSRDRSHKRESSSSEDRSKRTKEGKKRCSSSNSESSFSDYEKRQKHKKNRKRYSSSDSESDTHKKHRRSKRKKSKTPKVKRDIDKKRKGKKKKRDKDLSPNYKKCRK